MNKQNEQLDQLPPLDDFEQQWVEQLAQREADLVQSENDFVQSVMQKQAEVHAGPAVIGRIGFTFLPYAAAAAILIAAFVGWYTLQDNGNTALNDQPIAEELENDTQPGSDSVVANTDRPKVELGKLIAQATTANPTADLTTTVSEMPEALSVERLFELLDGSVPDLKEILAPLEQKNEQSRA